MYRSLVSVVVALVFQKGNWGWRAGESGFFDTLTAEVETLTAIIADHNRLPKSKRGKATEKAPENGNGVAEKVV